MSEYSRFNSVSKPGIHSGNSLKASRKSDVEWLNRSPITSKYLFGPSSIGNSESAYKNDKFWH